MRSSQQTFDASNLNRNFAALVQQEVDLGVNALNKGDADMAVTFFQSALQKTTVQFPFYDHLTHNLLLSYKSLIEQLLRGGDLETANAFLQKALGLELRGQMANDAAFRRLFADVFQNIGLVLFENAQIEASIRFTRKALAVEPCPTYHVNLTNALSLAKHPAVLSDFTTAISPEKLGRHIFIACVPKSASTFLKDVLINLTGYRDLFAVYAAVQNEHELYLPTIREYAKANTVTQQHCRASDANVNIMQAFGIRPIVLVRNIFDSVMSLLDFYKNQGAYFSSYFRADFPTLDEETQIDLLIDNVVPWYLQFVASWNLVEAEKRLEISWLSYEELIGDKAASIGNVLRFYGLGASLNNVNRKIAETETLGRKIRFNKGVAGRGKAGLSDEQKQRIRRLSRYYPTTDFSRIGL